MLDASHPRGPQQQLIYSSPCAPLSRMRDRSPGPPVWYRLRCATVAGIEIDQQRIDQLTRRTLQ